MKKRQLSNKISRMSGAGNTFFIFDALSAKVPRKIRPEYARTFCQSIPGLRADGFIFLEPSTVCDFQWDFYNEDGSSAEMCGNAARCAALYYFTRVRKRKLFKFSTLAGEISAMIKGEKNISVDLPRLQNSGSRTSVSLRGKRRGVFFVNTGVPHVIFEGPPRRALAEVVRGAAEFKPGGTNVTFVKAISANAFKAVTFERGVEDFTMACGTGAVAAAAYARFRLGAVGADEIKKFRISMPGGDLLVEWKDELSARLSGPAKFDFDVQIDLEDAWARKYLA